MMTFYDSSAATVRSESPGSPFSETAYGLVSVQNLMALERKRFCVEQRGGRDRSHGGAGRGTLAAFNSN
jgi:hypothetical protein